MSGGLKMQDIDKELSRIYDFNIDKIYPLKTIILLRHRKERKF
ncbi:spore coat protein S [Acetivibrio straminisolvens JCM 21531]|uniref:Spore coat protein S n=1 Tax=Acetivibrio straminisolvens JCM 21531 TaxID=1294263 RepID=W4VCH4_9FIRM|nr:spore coat protein S [Acetivibrio straminisolvens JCM 21531]